MEYAELYRAIGTIPSVARVEIVGSGADARCRVHYHRNAACFERSSKYLCEFSLSGAALSSPCPCAATVAASIISPDGQTTVVFHREESTKPRKRGEWPGGGRVEVYKGGVLAHDTEIKVHGPVYEDARFGRFVFQGERLFYVAEKKRAKRFSFFADDAEEGAERGTQCDVVCDFGERYTGKSLPRVFVLDTTARKPEPKEMDIFPDHLAVFDIDVSDDGRVLAATTFDVAAHQRLGIAYCFNRPTNIVAVPLSAADSPDIIDVSGSSFGARSPRFVPQTHDVVFLCMAHDCHSHNGTSMLQRSSAVAHNAPHVSREPSARAALAPVPAPSPQAADAHIETLVHIPQAESFRPDEFPGLYTETLLSRGFLAGKPVLALGSAWRQRSSVVLVDCADPSAGVVRLDARPSESKIFAAEDALTPVGVTDTRVVCIQRSHRYGARVVALDAAEVLRTWQSGIVPVPTREVVAPALTDIQREAIEQSGTMVNFDVETRDGASLPCLLVHAPNSSTANTLIAFPHGGPHSVFTRDWYGGVVFLSAALKAAILLVNYRGSLGQGEKALRSLLGRAGELDVADCEAAIDAAVRAVGAQELHIVGGSHGGFLGAHLGARRAYASISLRNPVIDVGGMAAATDIPDWCAVESGAGETADALVSVAGRETMFRASPIAYAASIKSPTLIMVGDSDRRVPPLSGHVLYRVLRDAGVESRLVVYDGDGHPLDRTPTSADEWVNIARWVKNHSRFVR